MKTNSKKRRSYARLYALLRAAMPEMDRDDAKALIVSTVTKGRTTSLREVTDDELMAAEEMLREQQSARDGDLRKHRSAALHQLQLYGIDTTDWDAVNRFVSSPRIAGKPFYRLTEEELTALSRKLRAMIRKQGEAPKRAETTPTPFRGKYYLLTRGGTVKTSNSNIN